MSNKPSRISKSKAQLIVDLLNQGNRTYKMIAEYVGVTPETVSNYKKRLDAVIPLPCNVKPDTPLSEKVKQMIRDDCTMKQIMRDCEVNQEYVEKMANELLDAEVRCDVAHKWLWLLNNWKWEKPKKKAKQKTKYKVVHKGERGNLRTPYRPDRIFR